MSLIVLSIVRDVNDQNSIMKNVRADDWTAELVIIASNDEARTVGKRTVGIQLEWLLGFAICEPTFRGH